MTSPTPSATVAGARPRGSSYRHAHWYLLAALVTILAGFWPSFFRPMGAKDFGHTLHGVSATLWVVALIAQSWLIAHGRRTWHRRVAYAALILLPVMCLSALHMVRVMVTVSKMPQWLSSMLAFIDIPSITFLFVLVVLALLNVRKPQAHKRFMAATVLLALPPALGRLYARVFEAQINFVQSVHLAFVTVHLILICLIVSDWRSGERRHLAYPLSLAFFVAVHLLMTPASTSESWKAFLKWFGTFPG